jgi:hypothetical protein
MSKKQELFDKLVELWTEFAENHNSSTKAGARRARKSLGEVKKLVTEYRKASVEEEN